MRNNPSSKDITFFHSKYTKTSTCWLWNAAKNEKGYGLYKFDGLAIKAHRFMWLILHPDFDQTLHVLHTCDTRNCVNPDHLYLGTHQDNMKDMVLKGRNPKGELHGRYIKGKYYYPGETNKSGFVA